MTTLIRIKRRLDEEPVENIVVKSKRMRIGQIEDAVANLPDFSPAILKRVATVNSKEEQLEPQILKAARKEHRKGWELRDLYKKPCKSEGFKASSQRAAKERTDHNRYKVHASFRGNIDDTKPGKEGDAKSKEGKDNDSKEEGKKDTQKSDRDRKEDKPPSLADEIKYLDAEFHQKEVDEVITCNGIPMKPEYVYDIYYSPDSVNWVDYACEVHKYEYSYASSDSTTDHTTDDENDEDNWRNDYPEDDDSSSSDEEDYLNSKLVPRYQYRDADESYDESEYEEVGFDEEGNVIEEDYRPVVVLRRSINNIKLQSDSEDD